MSNYQYPWEEIFQDCADLITVQIRDSKNVPETFPQLYQLFEKWYTERGKKVPEQRHFIRKMREELGVESGKKIQPYLYAVLRSISSCAKKIPAAPEPAGVPSAVEARK